MSHNLIALFLSSLTWHVLLKEKFIEEFYSNDDDIKSLFIKGTIVAILSISIHALFNWILL